MSWEGDPGPQLRSQPRPSPHSFYLSVRPDMLPPGLWSWPRFLTPLWPSWPFSVSPPDMPGSSLLGCSLGPGASLRLFSEVAPCTSSPRRGLFRLVSEDSPAHVRTPRRSLVIAVTVWSPARQLPLAEVIWLTHDVLTCRLCRLLECELRACPARLGAPAT